MIYTIGMISHNRARGDDRVLRTNQNRKNGNNDNDQKKGNNGNNKNKATPVVFNY